MSGRVTVKFNHLPKVIDRLRPKCNKAVDKTGDDIAAIARAKAPVDSGILVLKTKGNGKGELHAQVESGIYRGHGFYAGFVEFGANQPGGRAQPYMIPAAHAGEPLYVQNMTDAVREACRV